MNSLGCSFVSLVAVLGAVVESGALRPPLAGSAGLGPETPSTALIVENDYLAVVQRHAVPHFRVNDRHVIVALSGSQATVNGKRRQINRGDVIVLCTGEEFTTESATDILDIRIKPDHPVGKAPPVPIAPAKNKLLYDTSDFYVYEEILARGETRPRHTHNTRLTIVINATVLAGAGGEFPQVPNATRFIADFASHGALTNIGENPLRNIVVEFKAAPVARPSSS